MKFYIETFGCKVNSYESNFIKQSLLANGFLYVSNMLEANIIIINTCTVTNSADSKCKKYVRRVRRENKQSILVVMGCSVQNNFLEYEKMDIDILIGNQQKSLISDILKQYLKDKIPYRYHSNNRDLPFEDMQIKEFDHTRAFIKIEDGCDNFCTYCIIPFVRGKCRSKDFAKIISEAHYLVQNGYQEIVLTGIHTGSYNYEGKDLVDVIEALNAIPDLKRIRLSSVEITELNEKFLQMLKTTPKFCNHLHIPLQAGSDEILKLMHRKYDLQYFTDTITKIRSIRPDISITTDIIVGFPEESEEMFEHTYEYAKKIAFSKIHVFPYSKRVGTKSCELKEVKDDIKTKRVHRLLELSNFLEKNYQEKFKNTFVDVLIEEVKDQQSIGHTSNYLKITTKQKLLPNKIYRIFYE